MVVCRWFNKSYYEIIMKKLLTEFILFIVLVFRNVVWPVKN